MATMIGLMRLGRDAEVRFLQDGTAVANLSLAYNFGRKGQDGNRPSQWIDAALFGKQAEAIAKYLLKGSMHSFTLNDVHIEEYEGKNGKGFKMAARVQDVELGPRAEGSGQSAPRNESTPSQNSAPSSSRPAGGGDPFDDSEIPF